MVRNADSIENAIGPQWPGGQYAYGIGGTDEPQRSQRAQRVSCGRRGSGSTDTPVRQYIWGTSIDECIQLNLLVAAGPQSVPAGAYYLLQDLLYRAVALTNSGGGIVEAYDTDAYGNTLIFIEPGSDGRWFTDDDVQSDYGANEIIYCGYRSPGIVLADAIAAGNVEEVETIIDASGDVLAKTEVQAADELLALNARCLSVYYGYKDLGCRGCKGSRCLRRPIAMANFICLDIEVSLRLEYFRLRRDFILAGSIAFGSTLNEKWHIEQIIEKQAAADYCLKKSFILPN